MNADLTILAEQLKEELREGYRSPLLKYHVAARPLKEDVIMKIKPGQLVTVVDNETGKEATGFIQAYTPDTIVIHAIVKFDAKKVHFKEVEK